MWKSSSFRLKNLPPPGFGPKVDGLASHYTIRDYRDAFMTFYDQGKSGAVKVLFNKFA